MVGREHDRTPVRDETDRRDWRHDAACRDVADAEQFFPVAEEGPALRAQEARAKAVCAGCSVIDACRAWALEVLPVGVAGGLTAAERRRVRDGSRPPTGGQTRSARRGRGGGASVRRREAAVGQVAAGRSYAAVAAEYGVSDRTVARWHAAALVAGPGGAR